MSRKTVFDLMKEALFPRRVACASCGREAAIDESGLCSDCEHGLEKFNSAPPVDGLDGYTAAFIYNDVSAAMVKKLKYGGRKYVARVLADAISIPSDWIVDAVIPVPLHWKRQNKRGFNQSELIAKHLCKRLGMNMDPSLLIRKKDTPQQTKMTEAGRKRNMKNAFLANELCKGKKVLLIDDVRTTGATLSECAKTLKAAGCCSVYAATVCFAKPDK